MSDSSRPHGLQPTRLLRPWDFPGKSTGVGCHCLLQQEYTRCLFSDPSSPKMLRTNLTCSLFLSYEGHSFLLFVKSMPVPRASAATFPWMESWGLRKSSYHPILSSLSPALTWVFLHWHVCPDLGSRNISLGGCRQLQVSTLLLSVRLCPHFPVLGLFSPNKNTNWTSTHPLKPNLTATHLNNPSFVPSDRV